MGRRAPKLAAPPAWLVVGTVVDYHSIIGGPVTGPRMTATCDPWQDAAGQWVVKLAGTAGYVAVEACTPAAPPPINVDEDITIIADAGIDSGWALSGMYQLRNGCEVFDVLTEPEIGCELAEACLPHHARFIVAASTRWRAAIDEVLRLRAAAPPGYGQRCSRCHHAAPNASGCSLCNPVRLGMLLTEANAEIARLRGELGHG